MSEREFDPSAPLEMAPAEQLARVFDGPVAEPAVIKLADHRQSPAPPMPPAPPAPSRPAPEPPVQRAVRRMISEGKVVHLSAWAHATGRPDRVPSEEKAERLAQMNQASRGMAQFEQAKLPRRRLWGWL
jgi:hypothetical protein